MATIISSVFYVCMSVTAVAISCHVIYHFFCKTRVIIYFQKRKQSAPLPLESPSATSIKSTSTSASPNLSPLNSSPKYSLHDRRRPGFYRSRSMSADSINIKEAPEPMSSIKYSTLICVLLFTVALIVTTLHGSSDMFIEFLEADETHNETNSFHKTETWLMYLFWYSGRIFLLCVFILRLYITFKNSIFEYSRKTFVLLVIGVSFMPIFALTSVLIFGVVGIPKLFFIGIMCASLFMFTDICISCTLLYLFIHTLLQLMTGGELGKLFIKVMSKFTLLYILSFVSSMMIFLGFLLIPVSKIFSHNLLSFLIAFDSWSNIMCVWLKLPFTLNIYMKVCGCCNEKCFALCYYLAKKRTDEQNMVVSVIESSSPKSKLEAGDVELTSTVTN